MWKQGIKENDSNFHPFIRIFLFDILVTAPIFNKFQELFKFFADMESFVF